MEHESLKDAIKRVLNVSMMPYKVKLEQASKQMEALEKRIDSVLDRSFEEDRPNVVCGEVFESVKEVIADTAEQLDYLYNLLNGYANAWHYFPDFNDDEVRRGFVTGYMRKANEKEDE